ncbi:MAG TPA: hypothetical protein DCM02_11625 [Flavobacterium sp.]|nr:hypothetical protein [Flavobacterium sp.]
MRFSVDKINYEIDLSQVSKSLMNASIQEKLSYRILPFCIGITWFPFINEDLSTSQLIKQAKQLNH